MDTIEKPSMRQPDYIFDVTGDTFTSDEVMIKFELSFGAACQVLKILADQNWLAAVREMDTNSGIRKMTKPAPVILTLVGKLSSSCSPGQNEQDRCASN